MVASVLRSLADADLLDLVRQGQEDAFTELYSRHREVAQRMASVYSRPGEADDLVDVAFEKVLGALRRGSGPQGSFRAYLFVTLRRLAAEQAERPREKSLDDLPEPVAAVAAMPGLDPFERDLITAAFETLPSRWQAVLWHTAVEGRHPRELASDLGMSANAVSALSYRAREKLRQAYLQAHLQAAPHPQCEPHRSYLGAYVRDGQSRRERRATNAHLEACRSCQALVSELHDVNRLLARAVTPWFLVGSAGKIGALVSGGLTGADTAEVAARSLREWVRVHHIGTVVGGVAATGALVLGLVEVRPFVDEEADPVRTETTGTLAPEDEPGADEVLGETAAVPPCPVAATDPASSTTLLDGVLDQVEGLDGPGSVVPTRTTTTTLRSLLGSVVGLLTPPSTPVPTPPVDLAGAVCRPSQPGQGDLALMLGGNGTAPTETDGESEAAVDVEVGGSLPVEAQLTIDLSDGARVALGAGLPAGCEMAEDRSSLTCAVDTLLPGLPSEIVGLEVEALAGGEPAATVTVTADDQTVLTQTVDLSGLTGLLGLP